jgi:hypothetical protein
VFKIDVSGATDVTGQSLPLLDLPASMVPVQKSSELTPFIDLAANTVLPNDERAEKWEGLTIGPRLLIRRPRDRRDDDRPHHGGRH